MKYGFAKALVRTWVTGAIYFLAALGYLLYGILWTFRFMQKFKIFFVVFAIIFAVIAAAGAYLFVPFSSQGTPVEIVVEKGSTIRSIARKLEREKIIRSSSAFVVWVRLQGIDKKIRAGKVTLQTGEGILSAAPKFLHPQPVEIAMTVPEGLTVEQTASIVAHVFGVDSSVFVNVCSDSQTVDRLEIPGSLGRRVSFSRYLSFSSGCQGCRYC